MNKEYKHNSLGIPKGYFTDLKNDILREVEVMECEEYISSNFGRSAGFITPPDFFHSLTSSILLKGEITENKIFNIRKIITWTASMAACLALVCTFVQYNDDQRSSSVTFDEMLNEMDLSSDFVSYLEIEELSTLISDSDFPVIEIQYFEENPYEFLLEDEDLMEEMVIEYLEI